MVPKKLLSALKDKNLKTFLISAHVHLEGDALGSQLALASLLRRFKKKVIVVNEDKAPLEYSFLPGIGAIKNDIIAFDYDAAVLVDCSDISRVGKVAKIIDKNKPIFNIDHHVSNTKFADINWIEAHVSSASEMIYELFKAFKISLSRDEALLIYTGILVDTGSFKYSTTTARAHEIAADLIRLGVDVYGIYRRLNESMPAGLVKVLGKIISELEVSANGKFAWATVRNSWMKKEPLLAEQTDALISSARSIKGVEVALLFKEIKSRKEVRVNLRSAGNVDVNALARLFGGGGHKMASGCTLKGGLKEAIAKVTGVLEDKFS